MTARVSVLVLATILFGCASKEAPQKEAEKPRAEKTLASPPPTIQASPPKATPAPAAVSRLSDEEEITALSLDKIVAVSLLSPRSLSLKLQLKNGLKAVFKPIRKDDTRARYEVAAYRIARLISVGEVPAAVMREIPSAFLEERLNIDNKESAIALKDALPPNAAGTARGAVIEWIEDIDPKGLEYFGGMAEINKLLSPGRPDDGEEPLAAKASAMVVFDHLIGNWDRFSGGNFFVSKDGLHLILIDHNGSFASWSKKRKERMEKRLDSTERFSASLVDRIRGLTAEVVRDAVKAEPLSNPLITDEEIKLLLSRRDEILSHVDLLVKKKGTTNTLAFP
jgi:hypothetical protein